MTTVAIMQPTYLPWVGYFALMDIVDTFVVLDSVQFARRSWQQRNRIKTANGEHFLTVPVYKKGLRDQKISEVTINYDDKPLMKHKRTLDGAYSKAPHFKKYADELFEIYDKAPEHLLDLNLDIIEWMRTQLGITTPIIRSSSMELSEKRADLIAAICVEARADVYVSPPGSRDYLDESTALNDNNVELWYLDYTCQTYPQLHGEFTPFLSTLDLMFNIGTDSLNTIRAGINITNEFGQAHRITGELKEHT